jgi:excisionase family DNA binding protein
MEGTVEPMDNAKLQDGDLLYGATAIAAHLGIRKRQALYLIESNRLPHFRIGKIVCARRSLLSQWLAGLSDGLGPKGDCREPEGKFTE